MSCSIDARPDRLNHALVDTMVQRLGMRSAFTFSRGSAGLHTLLAALARRDGPGEVIIPSLCCETVALAALYAGHTVRFADVSPESLCLTPATIAPYMSERTRAVLVVHLFGMDAQTAAFAPLRRAFPQTAFVEDIAHAFGGHDAEGHLLGAGLDYTLMSFSDGKMVGGDGGMLLLGERAMPDTLLMREAPQGEARQLPPRLALSLRNLVHSVADLWREEDGRRSPPIFTQMLDRFRSLVVVPGFVAHEQVALTGCERIAESTERRLRHYAAYRSQISTSSVAVPEFHAGSTCWRCPALFDTPGRAGAVTAAMRAAGLQASNHFFPLSVLFGQDRCPVAEDLALRMVNFWVDESISEDHIRQTVAIVHHI